MTLHSKKHITFAIFPTRERAEKVHQAIDTQISEHVAVDVITDSTELSPGFIPLRMTMVGKGALAGILATTTLTLLAITALVWAGVGPLGHHPMAVYLTTGIAVLLAAPLGALAGSLALITEANATLNRLRGLIDHGFTVLLVESRVKVNALVDRHGAVQTGMLV